VGLLGVQKSYLNSNDCKGPPSSELKNRYILGIIVMVEVISPKI